MVFSRGALVRRAPKRLGLVSASCGLVAVLFIVLGWGGLIFVIGGVVVPAWAVSVVLCATSLVLAVIDGRTRAKLRDQGVLRETPRPYVLAAYALISLATVGCVFAMLGDAVYSATYKVLTPVAPDGCMAVVREASFFVAGQGEVYAVHPLASIFHEAWFPV